MSPPDLTAKQLDALLLFAHAWAARDRGTVQLRTDDRKIGVDGAVQSIDGALSGFSFGSTTISVLKRRGFIVKVRYGYRITELALAGLGPR